MTTPDFADRTAKRIANLLMPGEVVRYAARRHWLSYSRACFFVCLALLCFAVSLGLRVADSPLLMTLSSVSGGAPERRLAEWAGWLALLVAAGSALSTAILNWTLIMAVTNRRIILRMGLIARDTTDLPLSKIDIVMVDQGVLDRITGCGSVAVRTVSEATTSFVAIDEPTAFRNAVIGAIEEATRPDASGKSS